MGSIAQFLKYAVTALALLALPTAALAEEETIDLLFERLQNADPHGAEQIEAEIWAEWSKSGSAAMDFLLDRGREALEMGDADAAIGHFSALIDHAPEFAEGYNARAMAFYQLGQYGPAMEDIRVVLALNPRHFGALSGLALIFEELEFRDGALELWREVEALHPQREGLAEAIERLSREVEGETL